MIEERLRNTLDQVAAGGPSEAGAYDRFLRQRARRTRRVAATTALGLAVVLALVAMLPGQRWGGDDKERTPALGQARPEHWRPGPRVAAAPLQGFEVLIPPGWEVNRTQRGFELRPIAEDLRRQLPTPIQLDTFVLDPKDHPQGAELFQDNNEFGGDISGRIGRGEARTTGTSPAAAGGCAPTAEPLAAAPPSGTRRGHTGARAESRARTCSPFACYGWRSPAPVTVSGQGPWTWLPRSCARPGRPPTPSPGAPTPGGRTAPTA